MIKGRKSDEPVFQIFHPLKKKKSHLFNHLPVDHIYEYFFLTLKLLCDTCIHCFQT